MTRPILSVTGLRKHFGADVLAVDDVSLEIAEGEFFALLGPSGCGKTTLLRMLAGFELPGAGQIIIDGQDMADVPPNRRPVNMVFQSYAVFPHMSVADNVGYGLKLERCPADEIAARVAEALALVQLEEFGPRRPHQLSGGQRQRVALARALVKRPRVLLLDEPLSALDAKLREAMQMELVNLQHTVGITFIVVTHDQNEALSMADRIAVMEAGKVRQIAGPGELYEFPNCRFVADFIGKMNLFEGRILSGSGDGEADSITVTLDGIGELRLPDDGRGGGMAGPVGVAVRPEKVRLKKTRPTGPEVAVCGRVRQIAYQGNESHVFLRTEQGLEIAATIQNARRRTTPVAAAGDTLWACWHPRDLLILRD